MSAERGRKRPAPRGRSVKPTEPTIPAERVPDFLGLAREFRTDQEFAVWHDLSQRGDKALRRKLFQARAFVNLAYEWRGPFKIACKPLGIKGDNIEAMAVRLLFGRKLDKHAVHDWSCVIRYWRECEPEQQDVEAAAERTLIELKLAYRAKKRLLEAGSPVATDVQERESLAEFVSASLSDFEPDIVVDHEIGQGAASSDRVYVHLTREYPNGTMHLYAVPLSAKGVRECVPLVQAAEKNTTTRQAIWADEPVRRTEAAD